jgi:hypothetical protein
LAGEPAGDHVDAAERRPVCGGDVAEVGHARAAVRQHAGGGGVDLGVRDHLGAEQAGDGHVQSAVPAEQGQQAGSGQRLVDGELPGQVLAEFEVTGRALHAPPTFVAVPWTLEGAGLLSAALRDVDEPLGAPQAVWWWCTEWSQQRRGTLYGWRDGAGLVVARRFPGASGRLADEVLWVPADLIRDRFE